MIELNQIHKSFGEKQVLQDLSLALPEKGMVSFIGPSGCGKTTLLRLILGLEKPDSGTVTSDISRHSVVFENDVLLPWRTVFENVSVVNEDADEKNRKVLEAVGLGAEGSSMPADLSGGMKRRVAIARALAYQGDCYILDEPTIRLNDEIADTVMNLFKQEANSKLVLFVTHNIDLAERFSDVMYRWENDRWTSA